MLRILLSFCVFFSQSNKANAKSSNEIYLPFTSILSDGLIAIMLIPMSSSGT